VTERHAVLLTPPARRALAELLPPSVAAAAWELITGALADDPWRVGKPPPDEHQVGWAVRETSNLCRVLGLLSVGGDWRDHSYGFTATGQATALAALRARAIGPRTIPWS
jgi:hypothetical protein